jgi:NAD(P)-dependent dehydrogenase (short-subunit alcohol dehydrogenase family)
MAQQFRDKVALVVGGTSGIGESTAIAFGREGAKVVVAGRRVKEGKEIIDAIRADGGEAIFVQTDVLQEATVETLVSKTLETYGGIDYALNSSGVESTGPDDWDNYVNTYLKGRWVCMKYEIPAMIKQGGGAIVNISSSSGLPGGNVDRGSPIGIACSYGIIGLTRATALRHSREGIRVNAVCVGAIWTPLSERIVGRWNQTHPGEDLAANLLKIHPSGRLGTPEEIAGMVLFLCSESASYITGCAIPADGGLSAG